MISASLLVRARPTPLALLLIALGTPPASLHSQAISQLPTQPKQQTTLPPLISKDFEQFIPYWTAEGSWHSDLQLRNNLNNEDLTVTPAVRGADGSEFPLPAVTIKPHEIQSIDINTAVQAVAPQLAASYGSLVLRYHSKGLLTLYAAVMAHDMGHPLAFHLDAINEVQNYDQLSREGVWWLPRASVQDFLILTNQSKFTMNLSLTLFDQTGKSVQQKLPLGPRQTTRLSVRQLLLQQGLTGTYGGVKIQSDAHAGSLDTVHVLFDEVGGFSANLKMFDLDPKAHIEERDYARTGDWTLRAPMLALPSPDPALLFPGATVLQPQLFVRNTTNHKVTATLQFNWRTENTTGKASGPTLQLQPNETRRVDVTALVDGNIIPKQAHWAAVILRTNGQPDEVLAVAASYDETLRYGAQTPFSDQMTYRWEGGQWEVDRDHDSIITAGNGGTKPIKASFTIHYNRGVDKYELEQTLQPDDQMWMDVGELIRRQIPDKTGKVLPVDLTTGSYEFNDLTSHGPANLFEGKVIYDKTFGHVAYGCASCCADGPPISYLPNPVGVGVGDPGQIDVDGYDSCSGATDSIIDDFTSWSSSNTSIASVVASSGRVTGVAVGTATQSSPGYYLNGGIDIKHCHMLPANPSGPANVVALACSSSVTRGGSATCTLSGPQGTIATSWQFTDNNNNTVTRTSNTTSITWSGIMVTSGTVTVTAGGASASSNIAVNNRTNFAFKAVTPTQVSGNSITCNASPVPMLTSPPTPTSDLGHSCANLAFSFVTAAPISDNGPNNGYQYITSASSTAKSGQTTQFPFVIVSDLLSPSTFYNAQCGTFSSSNSSGFIAGSQLAQNTFDHEQGPVLSHWTEYVAAQNNSSNNLGTVLESQLGGPGMSPQNFSANATTAANNAASNIDAATYPEPCGGSTTYDSSQACRFCGSINYGPSYTSCGNSQPVPHCQ